MGPYNSAKELCTKHLVVRARPLTSLFSNWQGHQSYSDEIRCIQDGMAIDPSTIFKGQIYQAYKSLCDVMGKTPWIYMGM
jgi:hypothetical protein